MTAAIPFAPLSKINAEENLAAYIAHARTEIAAFGPDLDFEENVWDITAHCLALGHRGTRQGRIRLYFTQRLDEGGAPLSQVVLTFAKAYIRCEVAHLNPAAMRHATNAFRFIDQAMAELQVASICECDAAVFNKAVSLMSADGSLGRADSVGPRIGQIARFLDENGMAIYPLSSWKYTRQKASTNGRVGKEFEDRLQALMPSPEALDALPQAFHLATDSRDVLVTSVAAILCSAPERVNEVLVLASNCEVEQVGDNDKTYLGLRWAGSKGFADHVKLILPGMADVVREALRRIRAVTEPARLMAKWYEENPGRLYLPPEFEYLRSQEIIEFEDMGVLLGFKANRNNMHRWVANAKLPIVTKTRGPTKRKVRAVRFSDFELFVVSQLPLGFPVCDARQGLMYSDALLVIPAGMFSNSDTASRCMFEPLKYHHVGCALGQNSGARSVTVFQRVGLDPDRRLVIKSHQFRHYLNTLAQGANLSQVDIAKWSGRTSVAQNAAYDHVTSEEIVQKIRAAVGDHAKAIGPLAEIPKALPVSRAEFAQMAVPTAHVTLYGFCIHDFTTTPCEMFRKCLDCREHVCIKGVPGKVERVRQSLEMARANLAQARAAVADEIYGAEDWVAAHLATVERLEQLLSILTDPHIADGAVIQLSAAGIYSLSEGAIRDHAALTGNQSLVAAMDRQPTLPLPPQKPSP